MVKNTHTHMRTHTNHPIFLFSTQIISINNSHKNIKHRQKPTNSCCEDGEKSTKAGTRNRSRKMEIKHML